MEILNHSTIPFGMAVWSTIESELSNYLTKRLTLRSVVDFRGEYTFETDAIATKNLTSLRSGEGLKIAVREPIRMMEIKKTFMLPHSVIEDIKRNKPDFDNKALMDAANSFAKIENQIILHGQSEANITGILSDIRDILEAKEGVGLLGAVATSLGLFNANFIDGPFKLVISSGTMAMLQTQSYDGMSLKSKLDEILGAGAIVVNQEMGNDRALVVSQRGGDFELYSGLDVALGFEKETDEGVELFLIQTFAFRAITPQAAVFIRIN